MAGGREDREGIEGGRASARNEGIGEKEGGRKEGKNKEGLILEHISSSLVISRPPWILKADYKTFFSLSFPLVVGQGRAVLAIPSRWPPLHTSTRHI